MLIFSCLGHSSILLSKYKGDRGIPGPALKSVVRLGQVRLAVSNIGENILNHAPYCRRASLSSPTCKTLTRFEYILSLKISSADFMLKAQHMPRSVGKVLKMASHGSSTPFQKQDLSNDFSLRWLEVVLIKSKQGNVEYHRIWVINKHNEPTRSRRRRSS